MKPSSIEDILIAKEAILPYWQIVLYDYYLDEQVMIKSLLYITGNDQTWSIESEGEILTIAPFSFKSLFE
ncbi:hypothetical protein [Guptibacillus spartinae]|uniref:hypothetical protein n=1 Tax=Guptibacillus spartinae TaxID=3025679 RepID=UPI0023618350|nr:hypothetical protein [Pseudalkalibacillus spartinae]